MALTVKQLVNRHGAFVSAVTALAVGAALLVEQLLQFFVGYLSVLSTGQPDYYSFPSGEVLLVVIPFAFGFFASLWIIAPVAEELRLPHVITRAVLATGVAATLVFIVLAVVGVVSTLSFDGYLFGQSFPTPRIGDVPGALGRALTSAALTFISTLPLGVLAGVLLWLWRKDHPPKQPLSGLIDEV
ncbi:hypothetical protein BH09ACT5_BH09ACT5_22310 [soil metagenome]